MWTPTHIKVTVLNARGLLIKGKNGSNNCFVTIKLGSSKFQTSVKEKATQNVDWHEECEFPIPEQGNRAEVVLTALHRNQYQIDEFLGQIHLPLNEMDAYERPRNKWYKLNAKTNKSKDKPDKDRGELEVRVAFDVKSGSLNDLSKKEKNKSSTMGIGGSLLSLGTLEKRKGLKKFAKSLGSKMHISGKKAKNNSESDSVSGSVSSIGTVESGAFQPRRYGQTIDDADPGVISEDDDEFILDNLSHKSSGSSLNVARTPHNKIPPSQFKPPPSPPIQSVHQSNEDIRIRSKTLPPPHKPPRITTDPPVDEWHAKLFGKSVDDSSEFLNRRSWENSKISPDDDHLHEPTDNIIKSVTAPTTPTMDDKVPNNNTETDTKPKAMPRSSTLESIHEKEKEEKPEKKQEKRLSKFKYFRRDATDSLEDLRSNKLGNFAKQFHERIIIGHENDVQRKGHDGIEVPKDILMKYDGKSKEELMLIANDFENEVKMQKLKMKEMEDYLDNLLLRVMETHPKILQNPYRTQTSTKSG